MMIIFIIRDSGNTQYMHPVHDSTDSDKLSVGLLKFTSHGTTNRLRFKRLALRKFICSYVLRTEVKISKRSIVKSQHTRKLTIPRSPIGDGVIKLYRIFFRMFIGLKAGESQSCGYCFHYNDCVFEFVLQINKLWPYSVSKNVVVRNH